MHQPRRFRSRSNFLLFLLCIRLGRMERIMHQAGIMERIGDGPKAFLLGFALFNVRL